MQTQHRKPVIPEKNQQLLKQREDGGLHCVVFCLVHLIHVETSVKSVCVSGASAGGSTLALLWGQCM